MLGLLVSGRHSHEHTVAPLPAGRSWLARLIHLLFGWL